MHLLLLSSALAQDCIDLGAHAEKAVVAVTDDELDLASRLAKEGLASLACQPRVPSPEDLATLHQVRGAVGVYGGNDALAESALTQAKSTYPGWFNDRLGSGVRTVWEAASPAGESQVTVWPVPDDGVLYIDGQARSEQPVVVPTGSRLIQVAVGAEVAFVQVVELTDGQEMEFATGLPEPTSDRRILTPWLVGPLLGGAATGGLVYGASTLEPELARHSDRGDLDQLRSTRRDQMLLVGGGAATAVLGAASLVLHFRALGQSNDAPTEEVEASEETAAL
ncbi:MAG: hypothetical protein GY913_14485 [Proteobacteria bacterium]|nr:hypothetical protein [Pseudomonadota bacterium]MCP4918117.1 hypothetical protein [Pseudomonadota bacterium]